MLRALRNIFNALRAPREDLPESLPPGMGGPTSKAPALANGARPYSPVPETPHFTGPALGASFDIIHVHQHCAIRCKGKAMQMCNGSVKPLLSKEPSMVSSE